MRHDLGDGAARARDHRRAARHRLDHDEAEGLRPVDGKQQRARTGQQLELRRLVHFCTWGRSGKNRSLPRSDHAGERDCQKGCSVKRAFIPSTLYGSDETG